MIAAVAYGHLHVHDREAGQDAQLDSPLHALIDGLDLFHGHHAAFDVVNELVALAWLVRLQAQLAMPVATLDSSNC